MRDVIKESDLFSDDNVATGIVRKFVGYDANGATVAVVWTWTATLCNTGKRVEFIRGGFAFRDEVQPVLDAIPGWIPILDSTSFDDFAKRVELGPAAIDGMFPNSSGQARLRAFFATGESSPRVVVRVVEVVKTLGRGPKFSDEWGGEWKGVVNACRDIATGETWCEQYENDVARRLTLEEYGDGLP